MNGSSTFSPPAPSFSNLAGDPDDNAALESALALKADLVGGKVPADQLPSYVDDVVEYANAAAFPGTGAAGVIYVALDTSKTYRWSGSAYVFTAGSLAAASQAEMEAGTEAAPRELSPLLVAQAIEALGGSALPRGSGVLQGYTTPPVPPEPPPLLSVEFANVTTEFVFTLTVGSVDYVFQASISDPGGSVIWIDSSTWIAAYESASGLVSAINAEAIWNLTPWLDTTGGYFCKVSQAAPGGNLLGDNTSNDANIFITGGGDTTPEVPGSGHVDEVELIAQDTTKTVKPLLLGHYTDTGLSVAVRFALKVNGTYYQIGPDVPNDETQGNMIAASFWQEWVDGRASASLVAFMNGPVPTGGTLTCWAVAERV